MAGADTRGFSYRLEPVRRRREWKLDAMLAHLGSLNRRLGERRAAGEALRQQCAAQALQVSRAWTILPDPMTQSHVLEYLAALHARSVETEREIAALTIELRLAREQCASQQRGLELLDRHRAEMLDSYATDQARKLSAEADADWLGRDSRRFNGQVSR